MATDTDIGYLLNKATRRFRLRLGDALAATGLTPQQAAVLMAIARSNDGCLTPGAVADAVETDAATTSGLLDRLTRDGWIASEPNPDDGRSRLVGLTDESSHALPAVMAAASAVSAEATSCLSADEVETLADLLQRIGERDATHASNRKAGTG